MFDHYIGGWITVVTVLVENISIAWVYGMANATFIFLKTMIDPQCFAGSNDNRNYD